MKKLAVIIDPIETLNPKKDTTIAMLQAAAEAGLRVFYTTQLDLFVDQGRAKARLYELAVNLQQSPWYQVIDAPIFDLSQLDIILMRKDPPFDMNYIYTTYLLELAEKEGVLVANKPQSLRDTNEKYITTHFPELSPPTLISQSNELLNAFWQTHRNVIFKPLHGMGGRSIFQVDEQGINLHVILDTLTCQQTMPIMAQQFLPEIHTTGDKRVLIIDDYVVPYALARLPQGKGRGNLAQGAIGKVQPLTERDHHLAHALIPTLQAKGLRFVGIDVIGDYITEINVTSPTCLREIEQASGENLARRFIDNLIQSHQ